MITTADLHIIIGFWKCVSVRTSMKSTLTVGLKRLGPITYGVTNRDRTNFLCRREAVKVTGAAAARCMNVNTDTGGGLGDRHIQEDYVNHGREREG